MSFIRIQDRALGRWQSLLPALGVASEYLTGKHGPCPLCEGGKDRWRFDDRGGNGTWICSKCGAGNGVELVMKLHGVEFGEARQMIVAELPDSVVKMPSPRRAVDTGKGGRLWGVGRMLNGDDAASVYLANRGISLAEWPSQLRCLSRMTYWHEDQSKTEHPAMIAQFVAPDAKSATYHVTYLDDRGDKADVPTPRKLLPGKVPKGGAVRLARSADTLGVAEGLETALSAMMLDDVPVWATLTAGAMIKFQPPQTARNIIVYGDSDASFTGQHAAYALAYRLKSEGFNVEVRLPGENGDDWNDILVMEREDILGMTHVG